MQSCRLCTGSSNLIGVPGCLSLGLTGPLAVVPGFQAMGLLVSRGFFIQVGENLLDDHRVFKTGNDVHAPTTVPAGLKIGSEGSLHRKQTLKNLCSNGRSGSQVAVGQPRMDFITGTAGIGQIRTYVVGANERFERP